MTKKGCENYGFTNNWGAFGLLQTGIHKRGQSGQVSYQCSLIGAQNGKWIDVQEF